MKPLDFDELAAMPVLQHYEESFFKATGITLKLVPPDEPKQRLSFGKFENPFCKLVAGTALGCNACLTNQRQLQRNTARKLISQKACCFAGLTEVTVPVIIAGRHVATLMSGQVMRREPNQRDFDMVMQMLENGLDRDAEKKARKAYFETPVIPIDRLQAVIELLSVFAQHLVDDASRNLAATNDTEPGAVCKAKAFVQSYSEQAITLGRVLQHVHVSRFHFCKIFKKSTGMTLTEYVARIRIEKAMAMIADPSLRITEVVFASGFGSIPQFNSVFKRLVGMSPTAYRSSLRPQEFQ
ncbi:MAG: PocR ligand-binding domain-containing protein [Verrucomicrobiota bacterium]